MARQSGGAGARGPAGGGAGGAPIDFGKIIDSFGELAGRSSYGPRELSCARCGARFTFTPAAQKYVHEARGVPVSKAAGAAYCDGCARARGAENRASRHRARARSALAAAAGAMALRPDDAGAALEVVGAHLAVLAFEPNVRSARRLVAIARRARRLDPGRPDALYWEGRALEAAGDPEAARAAYGAFLERARGRRHASARADAERRLGAPS
jgi:tetratricopeptide (TPR) repeat protein